MRRRDPCALRIPPAATPTPARPERGAAGYRNRLPWVLLTWRRAGQQDQAGIGHPYHHARATAFSVRPTNLAVAGPAGRDCQLGQRGEIRSIATSCGATVRLSWPAPAVSVWDHRSRTV